MEIIMEKMKVGVVGATGMVGQRFLSLLADHPYFEVIKLAASKNSAGKTYAEALGGRWKLATPMPEKYADMVVIDAENIDEMKDCQFVFCAVNMKRTRSRHSKKNTQRQRFPLFPITPLTVGLLTFPW